MSAPGMSPARRPPARVGSRGSAGSRGWAAAARASGRLPVLAVAGAVASTVLVVADGRAPLPVGTRLAPGFFGLLVPTRASGTLPAVAVLLALGTLVACWWQVVQLASRGQVQVRSLLWLVGAWVAPLLVGPPLLSMDAYAYLAQGQMLARGLDPYSGGPVLLGDDPAVDAVDPTWRASPVPYGPLTLVLFRAVVLASDGVTAGVLLLRVVAVLGVVTAVAAALSLAPRQRRPLVLAITGLNPVTLVHLVGGVHIDGLVGGAVGLCGLALWSRRYRWAVLLAAVGVAMKVTILPLLVLALVLALLRPGIRRWARAGTVLLVALPFAVTVPVLPHPLNFLGALLVPGRSAPWYAPATLLGALLHELTALVGLGLSTATCLLVARLVVLALGAAIVATLLLASFRDRGEVSARVTLCRAGTALLVVTLCTPVLYGWYLAAPMFLLAACGSRASRWAVLGLSSLLIFSALPPLYSANPFGIAAAWVVVVGLLAVSARVARRVGLLLAEPGEPVAGAVAEPVAEPLRAWLASRLRPSGLGQTRLGRSGLARALTAVAGLPRHERLPRGLFRLAPLAFLGALPVFLVGILPSPATADVRVVHDAPGATKVAAAVAAATPATNLVRILPTGHRRTYLVDLVPRGEPVCRVAVVLQPDGSLRRAVRLPPVERLLPLPPGTPPPGPATLTVAEPPPPCAARDPRLDPAFLPRPLRPATALDGPGAATGGLESATARPSAQSAVPAW